MRLRTGIATCPQSGIGRLGRLGVLVILPVLLAGTDAAARTTSENPQKIEDIRNLLHPAIPGSWGFVLNSVNPDGPAPFTYENGATAMDLLYTFDSTLLPTVQWGLWEQGPMQMDPGPPPTVTPCNGVTVPGTIIDYFRCFFLNKRPLLMNAAPDHIKLLGVDPVRQFEYASNQGLYLFALRDDGAGNPIVPHKLVFARYTFVYRKAVGAPWSTALIVQHHSSEEPSLPLPPGKIDNIKALLTKWKDELAKDLYIDDGHPAGPYQNRAAHAAGMANLYTSDASLLPTMKDELHRQADPNKPSITAYFIEFLKRQPRMGGPGNTHVGSMGGIAYYQGMYTFTFHADKDGELLDVPEEKEARFTFVYRKGHQPDWSDAKIVQHHSSEVPKRNGLECLADFNNDGIVDSKDLLMLLRWWGPCE